MSRPPSPVALRQARLFIVGLGIIFLGNAWTQAQQETLTTEALLACVFYVVLLLNSYYSILCFSTIGPNDTRQHVVNVALVILYLGLAMTITEPFVFMALSSLMFLCASVKYALMLGHTSHDVLLRRKIRIDLLGLASCVLTFIGILAGYPREALATLCIAYALAQIHLFFIRPLYAIPG